MCRKAAQRSIERGAGLTRSLLAFARRQTLAPRPTDLGALLTGMRPLLERSLGGLITVRIDAPTGTAHAQVDPGQLEAAVLNLAINARDAMPLGGLLDLRAADRAVAGRGGPGVPPDLAPGDYVTLAVTDTGVGMDDATRARAFEPFFTTKEFGKGSGLGLSMVHGMVAQSGGGVHIDSRPGHGATVTLFLPRADGLAVWARPPAATAAAAATRTVLLVDDDDLVRDGAAAVLDGLGYRVLTADGGQAGLDILRGGTPVDALVTDYAMPGINGAVLVNEARRIAPGLPALLITGYASKPEGLDQVDVLLKPFQPAELAARLAALLPGPDADPVGSESGHQLLKSKPLPIRSPSRRSANRRSG